MRILQSLGVGQVHDTDCVSALARDLRSTEGKTRRRAVRLLASDSSIRNVVLMARALVEAMNAIQQRGESAGSDDPMLQFPQFWKFMACNCTTFN